jgi:hypothetical protein
MTARGCILGNISINHIMRGRHAGNLRAGKSQLTAILLNVEAPKGMMEINLSLNQPQIRRKKRRFFVFFEEKVKSPSKFWTIF